MPKQLAWRNGWIVEVEVGDIWFVRQARKMYLSNHFIQQEFLSQSPAQSARGKDMVKSGCAQTTGRASGRAQGEKGEG